MESESMVAPPYLAAPLRLLPFRAHQLQASRIANPSATRLVSRPYRVVAQRFEQWVRMGRVMLDPVPSLYLHEYTSGGVTIRGWVGLLDLTRRAHSDAERAVLPHEGIHPAQADELADRMDEMGLQPAPILLVHEGTPALRSLTQRIADELPARQFSDGAGDHHRVWSVRDKETQAALAAELGQTVPSSPTATTAMPPICASRRAIPAPPTTRAWRCSSTRPTRPCVSRPSTASWSG
jgi:hypothetical protein